MNAHKLLPTSRSELLVPIVLYHILVAGMITCLSFAIMQLGQRVNPEWRNQYIIYSSIAIALEAMITTRILRQYPLYSPEWLMYRVTEWIVILVAMKGLLYVVYNPAQILTDVLRWDEDFLNSFFTIEYIAVIIIALFIWVVTTQFIGILLDLEESVDELDVELEGLAVKDRQSMRTGLLGMIFSIGLILLVIVALIHLNLSVLLPSRFSLRANVLMLLGYFLLGFTLMAESEYFIQKARWYLQKIPSSPAIGSRWALYSLLLLISISAIVILLPTGYTSDLFRYLQFGVGILLGLISYLILLLSLPFLWLMQLLTKVAPGLALQPPQLMPMAPPPVPAEPDLLVQIIKSLLFWTIFLSVIVFSFRYYFGQQSELLDRWKNRPILRWLAALVERLLKRWHRMNRRLEAVVEAGINQFRMNPIGQHLNLPPFLTINPWLPARHQVMMIYFAMMKWNEQNGLARKHAQTPFEYAQIISKMVPDGKPEIDLITFWFIEARYTLHEIRPEDVERVRSTWNGLKIRLRTRLDIPSGDAS